MKTIRKMYEHSKWANRRLLEGLIASQPTNPKPCRLIAHIVQAELVWLTRLQGKDSNQIELWPDLEPAQCKRIADSNAAAYHEYLSGLEESDLDKEVAYTNQSGTQYETSIGDILTHVAMHGQYHRGQINTLLRAEGKEPVNVDMITYVRELSGQM